MRLFRTKNTHIEKSNPSNTTADNSQKNQQFSTRVLALHYLSRFGWLTLRQIGHLLYAETSSEKHAPGYKKARKLLRKLWDEKLIFPRLLPNNSRAYLLTKKGARLVSSITGEKAYHGENILKSHPALDRKTGKPKQKKSNNKSWTHRWVANEFVIQNGINNALTEIEILRRLAPFPKQKDYSDNIVKPSSSWREKIPDALLIREHNGIKYLTWVEVENSRRRYGDELDRDSGTHQGSLQSLALWLHNAQQEDVIFNKVKIEKVIFVITTLHGSPSRKLRLLSPIISALQHRIERFEDTNNTPDHMMPEQLISILEWIEVEEYILGEGPQLIEIRNKTNTGNRQTLLDILDEIKFNDIDTGF